MKLPLKNHKRMNEQAVTVLDQIISSQTGDQNCSLNPLAHLTHFWRHLLPCLGQELWEEPGKGPAKGINTWTVLPRLGFHIPERGIQLPTLCYLSKSIKEKVK